MICRRGSLTTRGDPRSTTAPTPCSASSLATGQYARWTCESTIEGARVVAGGVDGAALHATSTRQRIRTIDLRPSVSQRSGRADETALAELAELRDEHL